MAHGNTTGLLVSELYSQQYYVKSFHQSFFKLAIPGLFLYFHLFNTVDSKQINVRRLDLKHRPLLLDATALPTEPQPLPFYN